MRFDGFADARRLHCCILAVMALTTDGKVLVKNLPNGRWFHVQSADPAQHMSEPPATRRPKGSERTVTGNVISIEGRTPRSRRPHREPEMLSGEPSMTNAQALALVMWALRATEVRRRQP